LTPWPWRIRSRQGWRERWPLGLAMVAHFPAPDARVKGSLDRGGRPSVRVFTAGERTDLPEVIMVPGLGAPGYLAPCAVEIAVDPRDDLGPARMASRAGPLVDLDRRGRRGSGRAVAAGDGSAGHRPASSAPARTTPASPLRSPLPPPFSGRSGSGPVATTTTRPRPPAAQRPSTSGTAPRRDRT
jgi:hypothetical protein